MNTHDSDKQIRADLLKIARKVGYANSVEQLVREASTLWSFVDHGPDDSPVKSSGPVEQVFLDKFGFHTESDAEELPEVNIPSVWVGKELTTPIPFTITTSSTDDAPKTEEVAPEPEKPTPFQEGRDAISGVSAGILNHYVKMGMWNHGDDLTNLALLAFAKKDAKTEKEVLHCSYQEREDARNAVNRLKASRRDKLFGGLAVANNPIITPKPVVEASGQGLSSYFSTKKVKPAHELCDTNNSNAYIGSIKEKAPLYKGRYETCTKEEVETNKFQNVSFDDSPMANVYKKFVLDTEDYEALKKDQTDTLEQLNTLKAMVEKLAKSIGK